MNYPVMLIKVQNNNFEHKIRENCKDSLSRYKQNVWMRFFNSSYRFRLFRLDSVNNKYIQI